MDIYLVDGTYELFRHYFALPSATDTDGREIGATRGVVGSIVGMLEDGVTHIGVATDHVVESFRNELYEGYKTGEGIEPELRSQFEPLEQALTSLGITVWPMVDQEADDALAAAADKAAGDPSVEKVLICTPDKDLAQCVRDDEVVQLDRRKDLVRNEAGVIERFGVKPESIPDYLALVGDSADGFPGLPGWGARSASSVLAQYQHLEDIPTDSGQWAVQVRGAARLGRTLRDRWNDALLFRDLATLRTDHPVFESVEELRWRGPRPEFREFCRLARANKLLDRVTAAAERLAPDA